MAASMIADLSWLELFLLALIQGLTEFWPVSSSGHLLLIFELLGWDDPGRQTTVAAHLGALIAVLLYYRRQWLSQAVALGTWLQRRPLSDANQEHLKLLTLLALASLPLIPAGLILSLNDWPIRSLLITILTTLIFGVFLGLAALRRRYHINVMANLNYTHALLAGFAQTLALIPGTSRSGVVLTTLLFLGVSPALGARFSIMLGAPAILGAVILESIQLPATTVWTSFLATALISCVTAIAGIGILLKVVQYLGVMPFAIYRILLGCAALVFLAV